LDNLSIFTDQPWVKIDETGDRVLFVFRSSNDLLISKNGDVQTCTWEYLEYMDSLLIKRGGQKSLYKQGFLDEQVMIMVKDGQGDYLLLANENKVDERDPESILHRLDRRYLTSPSREVGVSNSSGKPEDPDVLSASSNEPAQESIGVGSFFIIAALFLVFALWVIAVLVAK
jgi:hypothetical protein